MKIKLLSILFFLLGTVWAQQNPPAPQLQDPFSSLWIGSYNKFRVAENWIWEAQHHYRRQAYNGVPLVGKMAKFYNRHAFTYILNKSIYLTAGGVLRLNYTPKPGNANYNKVVLEPRFWHQYMFVLPQKRFMIYHRIRIEHRWSKSNLIGADWIYRNRWRYKIYAAVPLNKPKLMPGAFYFTPDFEVILQSSKHVLGSPLEDVRIYPQFGYIVNPRLKVGGGLMYTIGQNLSDGTQYRQRWVLRLNAYLSLDFRKFESKIPDINYND